MARRDDSWCLHSRSTISSNYKIVIKTFSVTLTCAISGTRGSSGLGSVRSEQMDSRTCFAIQQSLDQFEIRKGSSKFSYVMMKFMNSKR